MRARGSILAAIFAMAAAFSAPAAQAAPLVSTAASASIPAVSTAPANPSDFPATPQRVAAARTRIAARAEGVAARGRELADDFSDSDSDLQAAPDASPRQFKNWGLAKENEIDDDMGTVTAYRSGVDAPEAWALSRKGKKVVVAVVDTGIDARHPDLRGQLWRAPNGEYGWDFVSNRPNPQDYHGHGTHVAGIIAALDDPNNGVSGVARNVAIMAVKYYSDYNPGWLNLRNSVKALNYAIDHGARIINYSGGGPEFSEDEYQALKRAQAKGVLVVAAAGNDVGNTDIPENYYYPAAYHLPNVITVAATTITNSLARFSDWGPQHVDIAAPGENIYSTLPGGRFGWFSGTSQATPFVTGVSALLLSQAPGLTPEQVRKILEDSADRLPQLQGEVRNGARVNAYAAVRLLESLLNPDQPRELIPNNGVPGQIFR